MYVCLLPSSRTRIATLPGHLLGARAATAGGTRSAGDSRERGCGRGQVTGGEERLEVAGELAHLRRRTRPSDPAL